jgi:hypothetical protein
MHNVSHLGDVAMEGAAVADRELISIDQLCERYRGFKPAGVRWLIFNEATNGLKASGAILRIGRRVYIDPAKFLVWVDSQQHRC